MSPCARQPFGPWLARHPPVVGGQGHKDCINRATFDGAGRRVIPEKGFGVNSAFRVNGHRKANRIEPRCAATSPATVDEEDLSAGSEEDVVRPDVGMEQGLSLHHLEESVRCAIHASCFPNAGLSPSGGVSAIRFQVLSIPSLSSAKLGASGQ